MTLVRLGGDVADDEEKTLDQEVFCVASFCR